MNYEKLYYNIINKAISENRKKGLGIYYEKHHIVPKSMGGKNCKNNLVLLTFKEHFICHKILYELYKNTIYSKQMAYAFHRMCLKGNTNEKIFSGKYYEEVRKVFCENQSLKAKIKGRKLSEESKIKIGKAHKNKTLSKNHKEKIKNSFTEERRKQLSLSMKDRHAKNLVGNRNYFKENPESKFKLSESIKKFWENNPQHRKSLIERNSKKVMNLDNNVIFNSLKEAAIYENISYSLFKRLLKNKKINYIYV